MYSLSPFYLLSFHNDLQLSPQAYPFLSQTVSYHFMSSQDIIRYGMVKYTDIHLHNLHILISSAWSSGSHSIQSLLYYYSTLLLLDIFQIFSSNLSKPMSRGGINWSLCGSNSLGTSHSTQGRDDSSSSSTTGLHCIYCILVYIGVMSVRTSR